MTQKTSRRASWRPAAAGLPLLCPMLLTAGPSLAQVSWTGGTSTDWFTGPNWSGGAVPGPSSSVTIDSGTPNQPLLTADEEIGALNGSGTLFLGDFAYLTVNGDGGNSSFGGVVAGDGSLELTGGRLTLTGSGTVLDELLICSCSSGLLEISGGSVYAESDTQILGGTLTVSNGGGLETLDLIAESTLTVTGAGSTVTVQGGTYLGYIDAATVTIAAGGRLESEGGAEIDSLFGSSQVTVTGSGSLWDAAGYVAVGNGTFGGVGSLTLADGGLLSTDILAVAAGSSLNLGAGGLAGKLEAAEIYNDGEIYANFTDTMTIAAAIDGGGGLVKDGTGTLILNGSSTFVDSTEVRAGRLIVNNVFASPVSIDPGGTLGGAGHLLQGIVNGGTIAPGNSIGTLMVEGDVTFQPGSVYEVEVDPGGSASDLLWIVGEAELDGGTVRHVGLGGTYRDSARYRILTAEGGVQGRFEAVESDFVFLDPALSYDGKNVYLTLKRNDTDFEDIAETPNHSETADSLESLGPGKPVYDSVVVLTEAEVLEAYEALSGELHTSVAGTLIEESRLLRDIPLARLRQSSRQQSSGQAATPVQQAQAGASDIAALPAGDGIEAWAQAFGSWGKRDADDNAAAVDHAMGGLLLGADTQVGETWRLGLFTGYDRRESTVEERRSSASVDSVHLGAYAGTELGALGLALGAAYSWHAIESERDVVFSGFSESVDGDYAGTTAQVFVEASYDLALGEFGLQPFAGVAYVRSDTEAFTESGGDSALSVAESDHGVGYSTLGLRAATEFQLGGLPPMAALGALGWRHAYGELAPDGSATLDGSDPFTIQGLPVARDVALVEAGVAVPVAAGGLLDLSYAGQVAEGYRQHGLHLTLSFRF